MSSLPHGMSVVQTVVTLTAATNTTLVAANPLRKYLAVCNIGTGLVSLAFGTASVAVAGSGWPLAAAGSAGDQGGALIFESSVLPMQAVKGISTAGSTVVVLEGI